MLKTPLKLLLAASIALPTALAFSEANAGSKRNKHHNSYKYSGGYAAGGHYYGGHYSYGYSNRRHHYGGGYSSYRYKPYYSGSYYYGGHHNRRGHGNAGTYAGLALLGLGLGYAISKSSRNDYYRGDSYYQDDEDYSRYYTPPRPNGQYNQGQEDQYQDQGAYQSGGNSFDFSQCQETRAYQTTIFVDGQEQQAFGTACLMPDGSWVAGPMQIQ